MNISKVNITGKIISKMYDYVYTNRWLKIFKRFHGIGNVINDDLFNKLTKAKLVYTYDCNFKNTYNDYFDMDNLL